MAQPARKKPPAKNAPALSPATKSLTYRLQETRWALINACLGGTETMRQAGEALLPKHEGESQKHYDERLKGAVFANFLRLTLDFLVGKPYSEEAHFRDNTPTSLTALEDDIDLQGNDITVVTKDWFWKALGKGWAYCMVEYPEQNETEITLAQAQTNGLRPYWVILTPEAVISDRTVRIEGKETFSHVRLFISSAESNGYDEIVVNRIYEYNLVNPDPTIPNDTYHPTIQTWRQVKPNEWALEKPATVMRGIDRIPLVKFQTNAEGRPELIDEAFLNVKHWQSSADQTACMTMARFPVLAASGLDDEDPGKVIGPYELLTLSDPQAKYYYVEHSGVAIGVGSSDIVQLEDKMAMYGAELLKKRPGRETATARVIDETQSMAPLQIIVLSFMSALEQACDYTLMWLQDPAANDDQTYGIDVNLDFALSDEQQKQMSFFENARLQGDVSRQKFLGMAKELGFIPREFNVAENETQLEKESADLQKRALALAALQKAQMTDPSGPGGNTGVPKDNPEDTHARINRTNVPQV